MAALVFVLGCAGCARPESTTSSAPGQQRTAEVTIGSYMAKTGPFATYGQSSVKGMELAVEEINSKGGVLGKSLRLVVEDDEGKPEVAKNAVEKLIEQKHVPVVIGEVASKCSLAAAPICQSRGVPMVSPSSTSPKLTKVGDYIFRVCFTDEFQGWACAKLGYGLGYRSAAVFVDQTNDYSIGLAKRFEEVFQELGGSVADEQTFSEGDKDFNAQLSRIKGSEPDVIFLPTYYQEAALIATQARQQGMHQTLIGGDGWDSPVLCEVGKEAVEGCFFITHSHTTAEEPVMQQFVKAYLAKYGTEPDALAALAYDAVYVVADAIRRAGSAEPKAIRDALAQTKNLQRATGTITIDENRDARKAAYALVINGGKFVFYKKIEPEESPQAAASTTQASSQQR